MDFSPVVSEPHVPSSQNETRGEKNPYHMENHAKCISFLTDFAKYTF